MNVVADDSTFRVVADASVMPRGPLVGEIWDIGGRIRKHPRFGPQVHASSAVLTKPSGRLVVSFLKGNSCPGIGAAKAALLWGVLGDEIYDALADPEDRRIADLIGDELASVAQGAWTAQSNEVAAYRWCDGHGLPARLARRLSAIYGPDLADRMAENPYRILAFSSWTDAERLARAVNVQGDDPRRLVGAVEAVIFRRLDNGHTAVDRTELSAAVMKLLRAPREMAELSIDSAIAEGALVVVGDLLAGAGTAMMERFVVEDLRRRQDLGREQPDFLAGAPDSALDEVLERYQERESIALNAEQHAAVLMAVKEPVSVLVGGAGTGKTTALKAIHTLAEAYGTPVLQAALAGRAARRMTEATGRPARTIMALLMALKDGLNPEGALIIIDESSMLDLPTTYQLLRALPETARLLFVGDTGQLPPIGFGLILHALAHHPTMPTVELTEVHRQAASTGIPAASLAIRNGQLPAFRDYAGSGQGISFIPCPPDDIPDRLLELKGDMPDAQIITALREGPSGTSTINSLFHMVYAGRKPDVSGFCVGEPVIWTVNDYKLGLMNGTLGTVLELTEDGLLVLFEGEQKKIERTGLDALEHAYAVTVHKAQGSQFVRILVPVVPCRLGDRSLHYTALTRATQQAVIIGCCQAFRQDVSSAPSIETRATALMLSLAHP
ncbi:ATP-dependent RecD-like DNA helicase [Rhodovulum tesquicola]|uniref:ATP-dependent DNA helicase n=1 Tax=Rhodovulum tesquicola TaxID=540254 RepID=UPI002097AC30|nr:AAA family ATPase [Rhodovulum tesquicola]MCO8146894.1 ATP-dependent RecD-like DNA helicase [Rhodovulum tesquicola]